VGWRPREWGRMVEGAGFGIVVVETGGVGQSEAAVAAVTDLFVLLLAPGAGDELQGIKRGVAELAHLALVNKADGELAATARRTAAEYRGAFRMLAGGGTGWKVEVHACSALTGAGIAEAWERIECYRDWYETTGTRSRRRDAQAREWLWSEIAARVRTTIESREALKRLAEAAEEDVATGRTSAAAAARRVVSATFASAGCTSTRGEDE